MTPAAQIFAASFQILSGVIGSTSFTMNGVVYEAIASELAHDEKIDETGFLETVSLTLQVLASQFTTTPTEGTTILVDGKSYRLLGTRRDNVFIKLLLRENT